MSYLTRHSQCCRGCGHAEPDTRLGGSLQSAATAKIQNPWRRRRRLLRTVGRKQGALCMCMYVFLLICVCVFNTAVTIIKLFALGQGDSGGHVLRETTSRGLCGLVCPSRTSERGREGDCVKERGGGEGEHERERALWKILS